jgi:hypothetical protein
VIFSSLGFGVDLNENPYIFFVSVEGKGRYFCHILGQIMHCHCSYGLVH